MTIDTNGSSGAASPSSGSDAGNQDQKDVVKYETYSRVLGEKKKLQERTEELAAKLAEHEAAQKAVEEAEMKKRGDFEKLLSQEREAKKALEAKLQAREAQITNSLKLDSVLKALDGQVESQYWGLLDLDGIPVDPTTNAPDEMAVKNYANEFAQKFSRVILKPNQQKMPNEAAQGGGKPMTIEEWKKLPLKEMKQHYASVFEAESKKLK